MGKTISIITLAFILLGCNTYKFVERHLDKKMAKSDLTETIWINSEVGDTIQYWDNHNINKPTLILIHGFGASTKYQWYKQVKVLTDDYRLILPNLYQFGNTKPGSEKYGVDDQVDLVHSLIEHLDLSEYSLMGVSYGGLISIELAHEYSSEIDKLIILDAPIKYIDSTDINTVTAYFGTPSIEELFVPSKPEGLKKLMYLALGKKTHLPKALFKSFHQEVYLNNFNEMRSLIKNLIGSLGEYQERDYHLEMPILLIWGENDMAIPSSRGEKLKDYLGENARFHSIQNSAHMPNVSKHKEFNKLMLEFLDRKDVE